MLNQKKEQFCWYINVNIYNIYIYIYIYILSIRRASPRDHPPGGGSGLAAAAGFGPRRATGAF